MATAEGTPPVVVEEVVDKGLKSGALGLVSSVVMGVASTAPAYSLAATLGLIVLAVGLGAPVIALLAFIPMLLTSIGYSELNKADPDCGTTFTWASRAFGPRTGWAGGWGIVVADVLVMASLAQVASVYLFQLFGAHGIAANPTGGWVLLVGIAWIIAMTYICYRGIEVSASVPAGAAEHRDRHAAAALGGRARPGGYRASSELPRSRRRSSWFNPLQNGFSAFVSGIILMLFIYWGWDTAVAVNEETADKEKTPGRAAIISTVILLVTYVITIFAAQSFAGVGTKGIGLGNTDNQGDVLSVLGSSVFGGSGFGLFLARLLILMVLSSAAASTQTTILPTARTTLSMAVYGALPKAFAKMHPRYLTPTVSTILMGAVSILLYIPFNYLAGGFLIPDAVTAIGLYIAFYYGLTGFACAWYYRKTLTSSARNLWMQGILPVLGGLILYFAGVWSLWADWDVATNNSFTSWLMPFWPHWYIGGVFLIAFCSALAGLIAGIWLRFAKPAFWKKETLTRATATLVPDEG